MNTALTIAAWLIFVCFGAALSVIDIREHRMPNKLVMIAAVAGLGSVAMSSLSARDFGGLLRAVLGAAIVFAALLILALIAPTGLGMGDVKLGAVTGLYLGWLGWPWLFWGTFIGFALGALWAVGLILLKRAKSSTPIAFGPFLILGVVVSAVLNI
ncbi:MAG: prepilin peptidase [Candidatus Nanopelagicales bacterium]|nr:prepilin peptidase [Candidatus Nanopelagicales bacterium]